MEVAAGTLGLVERDQDAGLDRLLSEAALFRFGAVAPVDTIGRGQARDFRNPLGKIAASRIGIFRGQVRRDLCGLVSHKGFH